MVPLHAMLACCGRVHSMCIRASDLPRTISQQVSPRGACAGPREERAQSKAVRFVWRQRASNAPIRKPSQL